METVLSNKYFIGISAAIISMLLTLLAQYILNKRSRFRYFVWHNRLGMTTDDAIFGSVKVTWNDNVIQDLYLSSIELINESIKDFENVEIRVFSNDTHLLSESTEIVGSTHNLKWTNEYAERLHVEPNQIPNNEQIDLYGKQRDYLIPVMNRGQTIRLAYINSAQNKKQPTIWIDVLYKGIKLDFRVAHNKVFGVSQPNAALCGLLSGILIVILIIFNIETLWLAVTVAFVYGLIAQVPGAIMIKVWQKIKIFFSG